MNNWTKVSDAMPEPEVAVLYFYQGENHTSIGVGIFTVRYGNQWITDFGKNIIFPSRITHWQPLPKPPMA